MEQALKSDSERHLTPAIMPVNPDSNGDPWAYGSTALARDRVQLGNSGAARRSLIRKSLLG